MFDRLVNNRYQQGQVFIDPPKVPVGSMKLKPVIQRLVDALSQDEGPGVYAVSGQFGAGKSATIQRALATPEVADNFAVLQLVPTKVLPLADVDFRLLLLAAAESLASAIVGDLRPFVDRVRPDPFNSETVERWVKLLAPNELSPPPANLTEYATKINLALVELNLKLKNDNARRRELREKNTIDQNELLRLVQVLAAIASSAAQVANKPRGVLLVIDDLDKFRDRALLDLFARDLVTLKQVPCKIIATVPYYVNFEPSFHAAQLEFRSFRISNIKTIARHAPRDVLPEARAFFATLFESYAAETLLADATVLDAAILQSAGVPREFFRVLRHAFTFADEAGDRAIDQDHIRAASTLIAQGLMLSAASANTRGSLKLVRLTQTMEQRSEWTLLDTMHVVEYLNDRPWYSVHPSLIPWCNEMLVSDGRVLKLFGGASPPPLDGTATVYEQMLQQLAPEDREKLVARAREEARRE